MTASSVFTPRNFPQAATMVYGIGAQKAGTTWLYELLCKSPECHFSDFKEVHYFNVRAQAGPDPVHTGRIENLGHFIGKLTPETGPENKRVLRTILKLARVLETYTDPPGTHQAYVDFMLEGYGGQKLVCDITPAYSTLDRDSFAQMAAIGRARFVFIMRDPVSRMWSQVRMAVTAMLGAGADKAAFEAACIARVAELSRSGRLPNVPRANYRRTITELESVVPAERIHHVFYENLFDQGTTDAICDFLGIEPVAADPGARINPGRPSNLPPETEALLYKGLAAQYAFVADRFGAQMPEAWRVRQARAG